MGCRTRRCFHCRGRESGDRPCAPILQTYGDRRFESIDGTSFREELVAGTVFGSRAGYREGAGKDRIWYLPREAWVEICGDLNPHKVVQTMHAHGWPRTQASEQSLTMVRKIDGQSLRVHALKGSALGESIAEPTAEAA